MREAAVLLLLGGAAEVGGADVRGAGSVEITPGGAGGGLDELLVDAGGLEVYAEDGGQPCRNAEQPFEAYMEDDGDLVSIHAGAVLKDELRPVSHGRAEAIGVAAAEFWPIHEVPPTTWKRAVGIRPSSGNDASWQ